jgi:hypothetical protein
MKQAEMIKSLAELMKTVDEQKEQIRMLNILASEQIKYSNSLRHLIEVERMERKQTRNILTKQDKTLRYIDSKLTNLI